MNTRGDEVGLETNMSCVRPCEEKGEEKRREGKWKKRRKEKKPVAMLWLPGFQLGTSLGTNHTTQVLGSVCLDMYVRGWAVMASAVRMVRFGAQGYVPLQTEWVKDIFRIPTC